MELYKKIHFALTTSNFVSVISQKNIDHTHRLLCELCEFLTPFFDGSIVICCPNVDTVAELAFFLPQAKILTDFSPDSIGFRSPICIVTSNILIWNLSHEITIFNTSLVIFLELGTSLTSWTELILGLLRRIQSMKRLDLRILLSSRNLSSRCLSRISKFFPQVRHILIENSEMSAKFMLEKRIHGLNIISPVLLNAFFDINEMIKSDCPIIILLPSYKDLELMLNLSKEHGIDADLLNSSQFNPAKRLYLATKNEIRHLKNTEVCILDSSCCWTYFCQNVPGCSLRVPITRSILHKQLDRVDSKLAFHLISYSECESLNEIPDIHRQDISPHLLQLVHYGIDRLGAFEIPSGWCESNFAIAIDMLRALGFIGPLKAASSAIYIESYIKFGTKLPPIHPLLIKLIISGFAHACSSECIMLASFLAYTPLFSLQYSDSQKYTLTLNEFDQASVRKFAVEQGDLLTFLNIIQGFVSNINDGFNWCKRHRLPFTVLLRMYKLYCLMTEIVSMEGFRKPQSLSDKTSSILKAIVATFAMYAAKADAITASYSAILNESLNYISIHPTSVLFRGRLPKYVVGVAFEESRIVDQKPGKLYLHGITVVDDPSWIAELASNMFKLKTE